MDNQKVTDCLSILQWNARSVLSKFHKLSGRCNEFNVMLISEFWLRPNNTFILRGFDTVRKDRNGQSRGGVLILINRLLKYRRVNQIYEGKIEVCGIEIFWRREPLILLSCYRPPHSQRITKLEWHSFFTQFDNKKVVFGGDFNVHSVMWGSSFSCPSGQDLWEALEDSNLSLLNDGSSTFLSHTYHSDSVLDLSIVHESFCC